MCQSKAEGGRRCAAHTRPRYQAATFGTAEWDAAAADYAATREGDGILTDALVQAQARGDIEREIAIETALAAGARQRRASDAAAGEVRDALLARARRNALPPTAQFERDVFQPVVVDLPDGSAGSVAVIKVPLDPMRSDAYYYAVVGRHAVGPHTVRNTSHGRSAILNSKASPATVAAEVARVRRMAEDRVNELRGMKKAPALV